MEKIYIGTKIIAAEEMDKKTFLEDVQNKGVIILEPNPPGYKVRYEDGFISWSPKETFERAYREVTRRELEMMVGSLKMDGTETILGKWNGIKFVPRKDV